MVELTSTNGYKFYISESDLELVSKYKWFKTQHGYIERTNDKVYLHRFLLNAKKDEVVDHINGDTLNNTRENLRKCTRSGNMRNMKKRNPCQKHGRGWYFKIKYDGGMYYSDNFRTKEDCEIAYNRKIVELHGEFARKIENVYDDGRTIIPFPKRQKTSKYKGIHKHKNGRWVLQINKKYIGIYDTEEEALKIKNEILKGMM